LWQWLELPESDRGSITANQATLSGTIEYYLCKALDYENSARSSGWWCDGVIDLSISEIADKSFLIVGVAYWAQSGQDPCYLAPFEMEFHFDEFRKNVSRRIVIRFGCLDQHGLIKKTADTLGERRPKRNQDWAFAVELTEPESNHGSE
jgi:hypothetical protein